MRQLNALLRSTILLVALSASSLWATQLGTSFTYQGRLDQNGQPANGSYQMTFWLYADASGGSPLASNTIPALGVTDGLFTADVDFGPTWFKGDERWLALTVAPNGSTNFTLLQPRSRIAPAPNATYASTAGSLTNGAITVSQLATAGAPPAAGQVLSYDGSALVWQGVSAVSGAWSVFGNSASAGQFLGTTTNQPLELRVNNARVLRLEPNTTSPNVIGGWNANVVDSGVNGATIAGGGAASQFGMSASNRVTDHFGTVAGGAHNLAGNPNGDFTDAYFATVGGGHFNRAVGVATTVAGGAENRAANNNSFIGGGYQNIASGYISTVSGGYGNQAASNYDAVGGGYFNNANGSSSTVAGGYNNAASGGAAAVAGGARNMATNLYASISGGENNIAGGSYSVIGGGQGNQTLADFASIGGGAANQVTGAGSGTIGGGIGNIASGDSATVPGGYDNIAQGKFSLAAGSAAHALHNGSFVWADQQGPLIAPIPYESTGSNQFCIRATGGVQLQTDTSMFFGNNTRQMLNLWGTDYGIGVQASALYLRSYGGFAWFQQGSHTNATYGAGAGGTTLMTLDDAGLNVLGATTTRVLTITGGADLAEPFPIAEASVEKGEVVVIDNEHPGQLRRSTRAYDTRVAGIVSGANGISPGIALKQRGNLDDGDNVALTGRVYALADASYGAIHPGDLLTTSDTPGHAMKVTDHAKAQGAILGKAMGALTEGKGMLLVLVTLQ